MIVWKKRTAAPKGGPAGQETAGEGGPGEDDQDRCRRSGEGTEPCC
jgi:hypothetical protein